MAKREAVLAGGPSTDRASAVVQSPIVASTVESPWIVAIAVMLATFMEVLDTAIASVALPYIAGSLSASTDEATWVLTSYLVANAIVLPASNWLRCGLGASASSSSALPSLRHRRSHAGPRQHLDSSWLRVYCKGPAAERCNRCRSPYC